MATVRLVFVREDNADLPAYLTNYLSRVGIPKLPATITYKNDGLCLNILLTDINATEELCKEYIPPNDTKNIAFIHSNKCLYLESESLVGQNLVFTNNYKSLQRFWADAAITDLTNTFEPIIKAALAAVLYNGDDDLSINEHVTVNS